MEDMDEIVREFLMESHENLDQLDQDLVALEQSPGSRELISSVFRTVHTIKGTSGFLAFGRLEKVTHAGENLLVELRSGKRTMDQPTADVLLSLVDRVRALLTAIDADGTEGDVGIDDVLAEIARIQDGTDVPAPRPAPSSEQAPAAPKQAPTAPATSTAAPAPAVFVPPADVELGGIDLSALAGAALAGAVREAAAVETAGRDETTVARAAVNETSIRVDVELLEHLMRQVAELVQTRNQISRLAVAAEHDDLVRSAQRLSAISAELQDGVMRTRMQPVEQVWSKVPRIVRDLSSQLGKQVHLELEGGQTELDRTLLEAVKDPLTHLVRNAVDHGLEPPADRTAAGKGPTGTLTLRASHAAGQVVIEVRDDGRGIDPAKIAAKAVEKGLRTPAEVAAMSTAQTLQLLFLPGFSTAEAVTNVSGRGVGMDVVRTNIAGIGGTVDVESEVGAGTVWRLRIPLTLAIMQTLTVATRGEVYAVPQGSVVEILALDAPRAATDVEHVHGAPVLRLRGDLLPLVDLGATLEVPGESPDRRSVVVVQVDRHRYGLVVDRVLDTEEVVVKALAAPVRAIGLYAGATLLGNGSVALIVDVPAIARRTLRGLGERAVEEVEEAEVVPSERVLVAGVCGRRVAIPAEGIARLEPVRADQLERIGPRTVVQYRDAILPVTPLDRWLGETDRADDLLVVVLERGDRAAGVVIETVVDFADDVLDRRSTLDAPGLAGSTVIDGKVTELLDLRGALLAAEPTFFDDEHAPSECEPAGALA